MSKKKAIVAITAVFVLMVTAVITNVTADNPLGDDPHYTGDVTVTLNATDDWSGVAETWYRTTYTSLSGISSQSEWMVYSEPFILSSIGNHSVDFYSIDVAGNIEEVEFQTFTIIWDTTPPETTISLDGEQNEY